MINCFNVHVCKLLLFQDVSAVLSCEHCVPVLICYWVLMTGYRRQAVILIDFYQSLKSFRDKTCTHSINC